MEIISDNAAKAIINAPIEHIDLTNWLFTLSDAEYQACSGSHVGAGSTYDTDGTRISINVESIAGNLLVQHYKEDVSERAHCRVKSLSDSFSPLGRTKLSITWELSVVKISETSCELTNHVVVASTPEFQATLDAAGIPGLDAVRGTMDQNVQAHNSEETPLFARDIETKARAGNWA